MADEAPGAGPMGADPAGPHDAEHRRLAQAYDRRSAVAGRYSPFDPAALWIAQDRERRTLAALRKAGLTRLSTLDVLEIGCGSGSELLRLVLWGADPARLSGVEALEDRAQAAAARLPASQIRHADARELPFPDARFDLVMALTLFSSLPDPAVQERVASEAWRVLRPGGRVLWYDMRMTDPRNRDLVPLDARRIRALFPEARLQLAPATLVPPLVRRLAPWPGGRTLCDALATVAPLRGHLLGLLEKRA